MKIVVTIACTNYLAAAAALATSAKRHLSSHTFVLCLVERDLPVEVLQIAPFDLCIRAADIGIYDFDRSIFRYEVTEAATAIKPTLFQWLFELFPLAENIVYLDPDMLVFRDFSEIWTRLNSEEILLTPHVVDDDPTYLGTRDNLLRVLRYGTYNLGFLALRRGNTTAALLEWWRKKLDWFCYEEPEHGIFVDQKWMDIAPCLFSVGVLRSPAYNVANWNVSRRSLWRDREGAYFTGSTTLALYHFSGIFTGKDLQFLQRSLPNSAHPVYELRGAYQTALNNFDHNKYMKHLWSYATFDSGEHIERQSRISYRRSPSVLRSASSDLFSMNNAAFLPGSCSQ